MTGKRGVLRNDAEAEELVCREETEALMPMPTPAWRAVERPAKVGDEEGEQNESLQKCLWGWGCEEYNRKYIGGGFTKSKNLSGLKQKTGWGEYPEGFI
ncbi:hypothetical protein QJS04_geneDACA010373 [Acorus gramineus]|uniref:Uncharacterized protein n=1 Tax=Acorus gramineus TaxID=55184 RepID=A0AAV9A5C2_ACOGR|nr:hypothetical protein QJS04_geneDACA010373 [Acorus gramineus]